MRAKFKKTLLGYSTKQVDGFVNSLNTEELEGRLKQLVDENVKLSVELKVAKSGYADAAELLGETRLRVRELEEQLAAERYKVKQTENKYTQMLDDIQREHNMQIQTLQASLDRPMDSGDVPNSSAFEDYDSHSQGDDKAAKPGRPRQPRMQRRTPAGTEEAVSPRAARRSGRQRHTQQDTGAYTAADTSTSADVAAGADVFAASDAPIAMGTTDNSANASGGEGLDDVINSLVELQQSTADNTFKEGKRDDYDLAGQQAEQDYSASMYEANGDDFEEITYSPPAGMEHILEESEPKGGARGLMNRIYKLRATMNNPYEEDQFAPRQSHAERTQAEYAPEAHAQDEAWSQPEAWTQPEAQPQPEAHSYPETQPQPQPEARYQEAYTDAFSYPEHIHDQHIFDHAETQQGQYTQPGQYLEPPQFGDQYAQADTAPQYEQGQYAPTEQPYSQPVDYSQGEQYTQYTQPEQYEAPYRQPLNQEQFEQQLKGSLYDHQGQQPEQYGQYSQPDQGQQPQYSEPAQAEQYSYQAEQYQPQGGQYAQQQEPYGQSEKYQPQSEYQQPPYAQAAQPYYAQPYPRPEQPYTQPGQQYASEQPYSQPQQEGYTYEPQQGQYYEQPYQQQGQYQQGQYPQGYQQPNPGQSAGQHQPPYPPSGQAVQQPQRSSGQNMHGGAYNYNNERPRQAPKAVSPKNIRR